MNAEPKQEHSLVVAVRGLAAQAIAAEEVKRALSVAEQSRAIVISTDADAAMNADSAKVIVGGLKALKKAKDAVLAIPKAMVAAVNDTCRPLEVKLEAAKQARVSAAIAWQDEQAREIARKHAEQQREAARLAEEARQRAAAEAPFVAEPEIVVELEADERPAAVDNMVRGSTGGIAATKVLKCELVNHHDCDPAWLELRTRGALDYAREQMKRGDMAIPGDRTQPVEERGVRFWYERSGQVR